MPVQKGVIVAPVCAHVGGATPRQTATATAKRMLRFVMTLTRIPLRIDTYGRQPANAWDESAALDCARQPRSADRPARQTSVLHRAPYGERSPDGRRGRLAS